MDGFIETLKNDIAHYTEEYYSSDNIDDFNTLNRAVKFYAQCLLIKKAEDMSTQAIISLSESNKFKPSGIMTEEDLRLAEGLDKDDYESLLLRLSIDKKCPKLKAMTPSEVLDAYADGYLTSIEVKNLMETLKAKKAAEMGENSSAQINCIISEDVRNAISTT